MLNHCIHGGKLYQFIGDDFRGLSNIYSTVAADVLDAWYPPSPNVLSKLQENLSWGSRTSPPLVANGLRRAIAETFVIPEDQIVMGNGSSDLIFRLLPSIFLSHHPVIIPAPSYGEYAHVLSDLCGKKIFHFPTYETAFQLDVDALIELFEAARFGGLVLVNPCNPTGQYLKREELIAILDAVDNRFPVLIDETYFAYLPRECSMESEINEYENLYIFRSLSKIYGLSGMRIGYALVPAKMSNYYRARTPPYTVATLSQVAAIEALKDDAYTRSMIAETRMRRNNLHKDLLRFDQLTIIGSEINSLLVDLENADVSADIFVHAMAKKGVLVRNISSQGNRYPDRFVRISVMDYDDNLRIVQAIREVLGER